MQVALHEGHVRLGFTDDRRNPVGVGVDSHVVPESGHFDRLGTGRQTRRQRRNRQHRPVEQRLNLVHGSTPWFIILECRTITVRSLAIIAHRRQPAQACRANAEARADLDQFGKNQVQGLSSRKSTPLDPPVPVLYPITRSTVFRCR